MLIKYFEAFLFMIGVKTSEIIYKTSLNIIVPIEK